MLRRTGYTRPNRSTQRLARFGGASRSATYAIALRALSAIQVDALVRTASTFHSNEAPVNQLVDEPEHVSKRCCFRHLEARREDAGDLFGGLARR